jgi:hypothetical protein
VIENHALAMKPLGKISVGSAHLRNNKLRLVLPAKEQTAIRIKD